MSAKCRKRQGLSSLDVFALCVLALVSLGLVMPKPDWKQVSEQAKRVRLRESMWDLTNRVQEYWTRLPTNYPALNMMSVPDQLSNTVVELNGHHFHLIYAPEFDTNSHGNPKR